ncbi:hypothetical protein FKM82_017597 [Ascaphus truei]
MELQRKVKTATYANGRPNVFILVKLQNCVIHRHDSVYFCPPSTIVGKVFLKTFHFYLQANTRHTDKVYTADLRVHAIRPRYNRDNDKKKWPLDQGDRDRPASQRQNELSS